MLDKLAEIDTSVVQKLSEVKQEQERLQGFLKKAEELQDKVDPVVYTRVQQDYQTRHANLERQAEPLRADAGREYKKLQLLSQQIEAAFAQVNVEKETLEFRQAIGELAQDELVARVAEVERVLEQRRAELERVNQLKRSFIEAFPSGAEPRTEPEKPASASSPDKTVIVSDLLKRTGTFDRLVAPDLDLMDLPSTSSLKTVIPPEARLIKEDEGDSPREYRLGILTSIGRTEDNHISLQGPGVSRNHAQVTAGAGGYTLKDLDSQNGTFVNDERITERLLTNGDRVRIGAVLLIFRSP